MLSHLPETRRRGSARCSVRRPTPITVCRSSDHPHPGRRRPTTSKARRRRRPTRPVEDNAFPRDDCPRRPSRRPWPKPPVTVPAPCKEAAGEYSAGAGSHCRPLVAGRQVIAGPESRLGTSGRRTRFKGCAQHSVCVLLGEPRGDYVDVLVHRKPADRRTLRCATAPANGVGAAHRAARRCGHGMQTRRSGPPRTGTHGRNLSINTRPDPGAGTRSRSRSTGTRGPRTTTSTSTT